MKKFYFFLLLAFVATNSFGQIKDGSKVLTTTLSNLFINLGKTKTTSNLQPPSSGKSQAFGLTLEGTYGKVKNSSLWSYGLSISGAFSTNDGGSRSHSYGFAPVVSYQKFFPLSERFYYSPFGRLSVGYSHTTNSGVGSTRWIMNTLGGSAAFYPFSVTFVKNAKTNILFMLGTVSLSQYRTKYFNKPSEDDAQSITNSLALTAGFNGFTFGIQRVL